MGYAHILDLFVPVMHLPRDAFYIHAWTIWREQFVWREQIFCFLKNKRGKQRRVSRFFVEHLPKYEKIQIRLLHFRFFQVSFSF